MLKIKIPTPCHQDWNAMIPNVQGRHCNACVKTVIDFTAMTDDEIKYFFLNKKKEEKVCGRFRNEQLRRITIDLPHNIFYTQIPLWKKYLAAILIVFSGTLFSCDTHLKGDFATITETETVGKLIELPQKVDSLIKDTSFFITLPSPQPTTGVIIVPPTEIQGDITIEPMPPQIGMGEIEVEDTPKIEEKYNKVGEIMFIEKIDTVAKKIKDTTNCNTKIFY